MGFGTTVVLARRAGMNGPEALATLGLSGVAAIIGARAWSLLEWWWVSPDIPWIWDPTAPAGYSTAGAFVGAGLVLFFARFVFGRVEFAKLLDVVAPGAFVALALTRLGCVFERCDPGRVTSGFGVTYPDGQHLHPFGAYLAIGTILAVVVTRFVAYRRGARAVALIMAYGVIRFVAEFSREAPNLLHLGHAVAIAVVLAAAVWWRADGRIG